MSFISYAQNFEDVMLWRALKHVQNGTYVDVGAQHPVVDSVSKAFYERGWRGIHIEPVPAYAKLLREDRPDETVLQVALADTEGTLELNVIPDTGLSTAVDAYAQRHQVERGFDCQRIQVPVLTLKSALTSLAGKDVHWLKIDVEGLEEKVLKGWDSQTLRPWIMVVEATIPNSPETDYASWDPILTATGYQFVYFDGLNRFYIAKEHAELAEAFSCPPNVFDGMQLSGLASSELCWGLIAAHQARDKELATHAEKLAAELNALNEHNTQVQAHTQWLQNEWDAAKQRVEALSQRTVQLGAELQAAREHESRLQAHAEAKVDELNRELQGVYASKFWRITWPLRKTMLADKWALALLKRAVRWMLRLPKRMAKPLVVWVMRQTLANHRLKIRALGVLAKHPRLKQHLRLFAMRSGLITGWGMASTTSRPSVTNSGPQNNVASAPLFTMPEESINNLSPRAARVYADLKKAIEVRES